MGLFANLEPISCSGLDITYYEFSDDPSTGYSAGGRATHRKYGGLIVAALYAGVV
jgi:hypothetical protein